MNNQTPIYKRPADLKKTFIQSIEIALARTEECREKKTIFHSRHPIKKSVSEYIDRIFQYMSCSHSSYVLSLILINRVQKKNPSFVLTKRNFHKFFITIMIVAAKFNDDEYYRNKYYSYVGGIGLEELNELQLQLMNMLDYETYVNEKDFDDVVEQLELLFQSSNAPKENSDIKEKQNPEEQRSVGKTESSKPAPEKLRP